MNYYEKLQDPRWQKKRLEIMQRDDFTCQSCKSSKRTLNVHHFYYKKELDPWEYPSKHLTTLCKGCHEFYHEQVIEILKAFAEIDTSDLIGIIFNTNCKNSWKKLFQKIIDKEKKGIHEFLND